MSDLAGNPEDRFSQNEAHIKRFYHGVMPPKDVEEMANSAHSDQTAPRTAPL